jgi:hypothetical protein
MKALQARGLVTEGNEDRIIGSLERRTNKGLLKKSEASGKWVYWTE